MGRSFRHRRHRTFKWAVKEAVDPEEMLVAALSSCHMLSFLHVARLAGFTIAAYQARGRIRHTALGRADLT